MTQQSIERVAFLILLTLVSLAFISLLQGFMVALFWAVAFAILFAPLSERVKSIFGERDSLVSVVTVLAITLLVVLPLVGIGFAVAAETARMIAALEDGKIDFGKLLQLANDNLPWVTAKAEEFGFDPVGIRESLSSAAMVSGQWVAANAVKAGQGTLNFTLSMFLMIYLLYFFLRDGNMIIDRLVQVLPLGDARERALFARFAQVVRATVKGTFVIGAVQGTIGGITFALLGIQGAVLWGVLMALFSLLPAVGAALIWVPAAIMLAANGDYTSAAILVAVGILGIGLADNLLRPLLVGRDTRMPDYLILLATLGGLGTFGISGLIIGPLIAALFITVWEMFEASFGVSRDGSETESFVSGGGLVAGGLVGGGLAAAAASTENDATEQAAGFDSLAALGASVDSDSIKNDLDDELPDPGLDDEFSDDR